MLKTKYYVIKGLKFFRKVINLVGIDIHFLQKEEDFDTIKHNLKDNQDKFFKNKKSQENLYHPDLLKFYVDIVKKIRIYNIPLDNKRIADVGCGNGNLLVNFKKEFSPLQVFGFDFAESALIQAKEKIPDGYFCEHDIYDPLPQRYDLLICTEVLEHLLHPEIALKNLIEGMDEGGSLFITVPNGRIDTYKGHINFWSIESWKIFIEKNTFDSSFFETGEFNKKIIFAFIQKN